MTKYQLITIKTNKNGYSFVQILSEFVTTRQNNRNLNCKGRSRLRFTRPCLQMPQIISLWNVEGKIIDMRETRESQMILTIVCQHFISYFPLSRGSRLIRCPLQSKSLAFVSNISTLRVSLLCGDTETPPCLVIYFVTFYFYSTKEHEH